MPRGAGGLTVAGGIAKGIDSFMQAFLQTSQMRNQEKLMKNAGTVDLLKMQIGDPNTDFNTRARLIDEVGRLMGSKESLAQKLGYYKLNEEDFKIGEKKVGEQNIVNALPTNLEEVKAYNAAGSSPYTKKDINEDVTVKRGTLTPNQISAYQKESLDKRDDERGYNLEVRKLEANYRLQADILNKGGFNKEVFRGFDTNKNYIITMTNGETTKNINLGQVEPADIAKARITGGQVKGKLGEIMNANRIVSEYENDNTSHSFSDYKSAKEIVEDFQKTGRLKEATIKAAGEKAAGTGPPRSPAQVHDDEQKLFDRQIKLQETFDRLDGESFAASENSAKAARAATAYWDTNIEPLKDAMKANGDPESAEYKTMQGQLNSMQKEYKDLEAAGRRANDRDQSLKKKADAAKKRLEQFSSNNSGTPSSGEVQLSPRMKAMIAIVKRDNPGTTLSDKEIAAQITAAGHK